MIRYTHQESLLGIYDTALGDLCAIILPSNNRSLLLETAEARASDCCVSRHRRFIFNQDLFVEWEDNREIIPFSLSPDGAKFAYARRIRDGKRNGYDVFVNREKKYECELAVIRSFDWLSNNILAWEGWHEDKNGAIDSRGIRYFKNNVDVTEIFEYQSFLRSHQYRSFWVCDREKNRSYEIFDNGRVVERGNARTWEDLQFSDWHPLKSGGEQPKCVRNTKENAHVVYGGISGPQFHAFDNGHSQGQPWYVFNNDHSCVGYCGIQYPSTAVLAGRAFGRLSNPIPSMPTTSMILSLPIALLAHLGNLEKRMDESRWWIPVCHPTPWKKRYWYADIHFFTAKNEMVVLAQDHQNMLVVIDEAEGPTFNSVHNIRYLGIEEGICYVGRRDNIFYRVVATRSDSS